MVHYGLMKRTWNDWGLHNGLDYERAKLLLTALQMQAAGKALNELKWEGSGYEGYEAISRLSDQIHWLVTRSGLREAQLATDLAHDIDRWMPYCVAMPAWSLKRTNEGRTDKTAPLPSVAWRRVVRIQRAPKFQGRHTTAGTQETAGSLASRRMAAFLRATSRTAAGAAFQQATSAVDAGATRSVQTERPVPKRRGPPRVKIEEAVAAMIEAVGTGDISDKQLQRMTWKELGRIYDSARRTTLVAARKEALSRLPALGKLRQIRGNSGIFSKTTPAKDK